MDFTNGFNMLTLPIFCVYPFFFFDLSPCRIFLVLGPESNDVEQFSLFPWCMNAMKPVVNVVLDLNGKENAFKTMKLRQVRLVPSQRRDFLSLNASLHYSWRLLCFSVRHILTLGTAALVDTDQKIESRSLRPTIFTAVKQP